LQYYRRPPSAFVIIMKFQIVLALFVCVAIDQSTACFRRGGKVTTTSTKTQNSPPAKTQNAPPVTSKPAAAATPCNCDVPDEEVGPDCKSKILKGIMDEEMSKPAEAGQISDAIQASATKVFKGDFEVVCAQSDFAYRNWYSKGKMCKVKGAKLTCIAWRD